MVRILACPPGGRLGSERTFPYGIPRVLCGTRMRISLAGTPDSNSQCRRSVPMVVLPLPAIPSRNLLVLSGNLAICSCSFLSIMFRFYVAGSVHQWKRGIMICCKDLNRKPGIQYQYGSPAMECRTALASRVSSSAWWALGMGILKYFPACSNL